jgi:hypothetical protein
MEPHQSHPLQHFAASLAGIARALEDFGYRDEAARLFDVKESLETKIASSEEDKAIQGAANIQK